MALETIEQALAQYNANLSWQDSRDSAQAALEAVRFLLVNRAQQQGDQGSTLNYESLQAQCSGLEKFLGAAAPRAFGRSRRIRATFCGESIS